MNELARVNKNGAKSVRDMVECFRTQSHIFDNMAISDMILTVRSYQKNGLLVVTDSELILNHIC